MSIIVFYKLYVAKKPFLAQYNLFFRILIS